LFALLVLRPAVHARPALVPLLDRSLAFSAVGAAVVCVAQLLSLAVGLGSLAGDDGWPVRDLLATTYVRTVAVRVLASAGLVAGALAPTLLGARAHGGRDPRGRRPRAHARVRRRRPPAARDRVRHDGAHQGGDPRRPPAPRRAELRRGAPAPAGGRRRLRAAP